ncbi:hypothetical protein AJ78_07836 [Emergomyces pasteurianus Ep9510]|uniref:Aminoglycoside phosphotransferase domain-containing protein n=1 Tax=Emergomyces pasteurianus Ep9510 TaxID=1447872 RepID=A0A1J9P672_9EURO|nr:hypothetical protein AJ78_07836 [Emergomyces pasteurianus Ep9510]
MASLPFGMILKWSDGTRVKEVQAMKVARAAGLPVPRKKLGQVYEGLDEDEREAIFQELKLYLDTMRKWPNPWGGDRICSLTGSAIRSVRVRNHKVGPCENEQEFNDYLISAAFSRMFSSEKAYRHARNRAQKLHSMPHRVVFSHGNLKHHNVMVHKGRISGFLDWESAGWYPEYWEYTTSLRFTRETFWWFNFVARLGGEKYLVELQCARALTLLTSSSYVW